MKKIKSTKEYWVLCQDLKAVIDARIDGSDYNRMMCWGDDKTETIEHWLIKCMLFKLLRNKGHIVVGEANIGSGHCDLIDLTDAKIYEVDKKFSDKQKGFKVDKYRTHYIKDIIFIEYRDLPWNKGISEVYKALKEWIL